MPFAEPLSSHDQQSYGFETGWCFAVNKTPILQITKLLMCCHLFRNSNSKARPPDCQRSFHARQKSASSAAPEEIPRDSSRRFGPNMVATFVGTCQPIPHFFLPKPSFRNSSVERGTRKIVIGSQVRKTFRKLLANFFCHFRFLRATGNFFASVSLDDRQARMSVIFLPDWTIWLENFDVEYPRHSPGSAEFQLPFWTEFRVFT